VLFVHVSLNEAILTIVVFTKIFEETLVLNEIYKYPFKIVDKTVVGLVVIVLGTLINKSSVGTCSKSTIGIQSSIVAPMKDSSGSVLQP
jgi:hypothetical protein